MKQRGTKMVTARRITVVLGAVIIVGLAIWITISLPWRPPTKKVVAAPGTECTAAAVKQLPSKVVKKVASAQKGYKLSADEITGRIVLTRPMDANWEAQAFVIFMPQYCGFDGGIDGVPITDAGRLGEDSGPLMEDTETFMRNGKPFTPINTAAYAQICISNTPPVASKMANGFLHMAANCDRIYPGPTWMQLQPNLLIAG